MKKYYQILSNEEINDWKKYTLLKFNTHKCKVMRLSSNKKDVGKP